MKTDDMITLSMSRTNSIDLHTKIQDDIYNYRRIQIRNLPEIDNESIEMSPRHFNMNSLKMTQAQESILSHKLESFEANKDYEHLDDQIFCSTMSQSEIYDLNEVITQNFQSTSAR